MMVHALAVIFMLAAAYAQVNARHFIAGERRLWGLRIFLAALGIALGWLCARIGLLEGASPAAMFFTGFGLVHVPAALVLFFKSRRGESPS